MAKKIRFALKMKDGAEVRSLQELQEYFDIDRVMAYYLNGKLEIWLADRYYDEEADQVRELDSADSELSRKLCEIFQVEYVRDALTPEEAEVRNRKIERLREITDDEEIIDKVDCVAFSQEELADLLDAGLDTIYLCGKDFQIPLGKRDMTYIGIESKLSFTEEKLAQYHAQNIQFVDLVGNLEEKGKENLNELWESFCHENPEMEEAFKQYVDQKMVGSTAVSVKATVPAPSTDEEPSKGGTVTAETVASTAYRKDQESTTVSQTRNDMCSSGKTGRLRTMEMYNQYKARICVHRQAILSE